MRCAFNIQPKIHNCDCRTAPGESSTWSSRASSLMCPRRRKAPDHFVQVVSSLRADQDTPGRDSSDSVEPGGAGRSCSCLAELPIRELFWGWISTPCKLKNQGNKKKNKKTTNRMDVSAQAWHVSIVAKRRHATAKACKNKAAGARQDACATTLEAPTWDLTGGGTAAKRE